MIHFWVIFFFPSGLINGSSIYQAFFCYQLLKHQQVIEELMEDNQKLRQILMEDLNVPPSKLQTNKESKIKTYYTCLDCFECRRRNRRRTRWHYYPHGSCQQVFLMFFKSLTTEVRLSSLAAKRTCGYLITFILMNIPRLLFWVIFTFPAFFALWKLNIIVFLLWLQGSCFLFL